jgi:hypothetical protein
MFFRRWKAKLVLYVYDKKGEQLTPKEMIQLLSHGLDVKLLESCFERYASFSITTKRSSLQAFVQHLSDISTACDNLWNIRQLCANKPSKVMMVADYVNTTSDGSYVQVEVVLDALKRQLARLIEKYPFPKNDQDPLQEHKFHLDSQCLRELVPTLLTLLRLSSQP